MSRQKQPKTLYDLSIPIAAKQIKNTANNTFNTANTGLRRFIPWLRPDHGYYDLPLTIMHDLITLPSCDGLAKILHNKATRRYFIDELVYVTHQYHKYYSFEILPTLLHVTHLDIQNLELTVDIFRAISKMKHLQRLLFNSCLPTTQLLLQSEAKECLKFLWKCKNLVMVYDTSFRVFDISNLYIAATLKKLPKLKQFAFLHIEKLLLSDIMSQVGELNLVYLGLVGILRNMSLTPQLLERLDKYVPHLESDVMIVDHSEKFNVADMLRTLTSSRLCFKWLSMTLTTKTTITEKFDRFKDYFQAKGEYLETLSITCEPDTEIDLVFMEMISDSCPNLKDLCITGRCYYLSSLNPYNNQTLKNSKLFPNLSYLTVSYQGEDAFDFISDLICNMTNLKKLHIQLYDEAASLVDLLKQDSRIWNGITDFRLSDFLTHEYEAHIYKICRCCSHWPSMKTLSMDLHERNTVMHMTAVAVMVSKIEARQVDLEIRIQVFKCVEQQQVAATTTTPPVSVKKKKKAKKVKQDGKDWTAVAGSAWIVCCVMCALCEAFRQ